MVKHSEQNFLVKNINNKIKYIRLTFLGIMLNCSFNVINGINILINLQAEHNYTIQYFEKVIMNSLITSLF